MSDINARGRSRPDWTPHVRDRLSLSLRFSPARERDIVDELAQHLDDRWRELVASGASPEEAEALALQEFRDRDTLARFLAPLRQARTLPPLTPTGSASRTFGEFWRDVRYATRTLRRRPGFAVVAMATLAIAIGAITAVFSVVRAALLAPLPFADANRLVVVWEGYPPGQSRTAVSVPGYLDIRAAHEVFSDAAAFRGADVNLTGQGDPERLSIIRATQSFQPVLGLQVALGRWFTADEDAPNQNDAVVLSDGLWRRRFGADPSVVGRSITLDDRSHVVVGIMAASSTVPKDIDAWTPIGFTPEERMPAARGNQDLETIARLRPGVTFEQARAALQVVSQALRTAHYRDTPRWTLDMQPVRDELAASARPILLSAFGAVALLLLIACANVANLLLARSAARQQELAVRAAIGASPAHLRQQLFIEAAVLGVGGAMAGMVIAALALPLLTDVVSRSFPSLLVPPRLDAGVFLFAVAITLASCLAFGLVPAWSVTRTDFRMSLADARSLSARNRPRAVFVVVQVAMAFALLVGGGLLVKSFRTMMAIDPGYSVDGRLTFRMSLPEARYADRPQRAAFWAALFQRLPHVPNVRNAAGVSELPLSNWQNMGTFEIEGRTFARADRPHAYWRSVSAGYFATMGIVVVDGRPFGMRDGHDATRVAIVDELARTRYWGAENPIGRRVAIGRDDDKRPTWAEIVGVVRTVRHNSLEEEAVRPTLYFPLEQRPTGTVFAVVQAEGDPLTTVATVRATVREIDPRLPIYDVRTLDARLVDSIGRRRIATFLIGLFGAVAVLLAVVGVYGVVAYDVSRRAPEMALRVALGADRRAILTLVLRAGLRLAVLGILLGAALAVGLSHAARTLLFGVSPFDAATYVMLAASLLLVTTVATYIPARRAATSTLLQGWSKLM
jgi:putative ABC transport system permease protein